MVESITGVVWVFVDLQEKKRERNTKEERNAFKKEKAKSAFDSEA